MKQIRLFSLALLLTAFTLFAFSSDPVEKIAQEEVPGLLTAIGDAGSPNTFTFEKWKWTSYSMEEDKVENLHLSAVIDCRSVTTPYKDLEKSVKKKEAYFHISEFPSATVEVNGAKQMEVEGKWETDAVVTIKGITKEVKMTFSISEEAPYEIVADGVLKRKKFGFDGGGPKNEVPVHVEAKLPAEAFSEAAH